MQNATSIRYDKGGKRQTVNSLKQVSDSQDWPRLPRKEMYYALSPQVSINFSLKCK